VDFPDSQEGLQDLKECLSRVDRRPELVKAIKQANYKRLLHPGADTRDILAQYVSMIKCLRILDPPGVLLYKVADPVRRYLRGRQDTIRSIVANLVGEGGDLIDENEQIAPIQTSVEDYSDRNWEPEPIDAGPDFRTNKPSDVISTLVSIYDSKDLFVKELQHLLASRLLAITDGNFDKERRNVEILKLRFGDAALQVCEVMLKDMTDSRRLNQYMQTQDPTKLYPTVISRHFWPTLQHSKLRLPGRLAAIQDDYSKRYATFKPDKRLRWLPRLGQIDVEVELQDRRIAVQVTPLQASIIELMQEKASMTIAELDSLVGPIEGTALQKALNFWVEIGVLAAGPEDRYTVLEKADEKALQDVPIHRDGQHVVEDSMVNTRNEQREAEQMRVYWQFIKGILTNLGPQPVQKIQSMLGLAPGYDRTPEQLGYLLEALKREGMLETQDALWRLVAK